MTSHFKEDFKMKYKLLKKIGVGNYTDVYKAENKSNKELRAIKIINLGDIKLNLVFLPNEEAKKKLNEYIKNLNNKIENMKICGENNENSIKYYESFETEDEFAIVMELADEDLLQFKKDKKLNSEEIYKILIQLNNTFKIMNEKKIVHNNLNPRNILIKYKNEVRKDFIVKLCGYKTNYRGIKSYMAPEIIESKEGNNYNYKHDLWSLGIIIYELYFGEVPYKGVNENVILMQIGKKQLKKTNDENLDDLISKLLEKDPIKRMTWDEYFNHSFFNKEIKVNF